MPPVAHGRVDAGAGMVSVLLLVMYVSTEVGEESAVVSGSSMHVFVFVLVVVDVCVEVARPVEQLYGDVEMEGVV
jgi:hypothetical protein